MVVVSTADFLILQKHRVDIYASIEEGREYLQMSNEWRFWKREYWQDFKLIKPRINATVVLSALSPVMLNIGENISFGSITANIAGTTQNFDYLSVYLQSLLKTRHFLPIVFQGYHYADKFSCMQI